MDKIYDKLCDILDEYEKKQNLNPNDIQIIDWATHAKKSILCIWEKEGGEPEMSNASSNRGSYRGSYNSYEGGGSNRSMSRRSMRRNSRGQYSRENGGYSGHDGFIGQLEELADNAPDDKTRQVVERMIMELDNQ